MKKLYSTREENKMNLEKEVMEICREFEFRDAASFCRNAADDLLVGSFAAELVGESYPFNKAMCKIVFDSYDDLELGKKFTQWTDKLTGKTHA
jgi:hypothetical protein